MVDLDKIARGEHAENAHRKDFTWTEVVAIKQAIEPLVPRSTRKSPPSLTTPTR